MPNVTFTGHLRVPSADLSEVETELPRHIELTRAEAGCVRFEVTQDPNDPSRYEVNEEFIDAEAFRAHQLRVRSSPWEAVAARVERHDTVSGLSDA
ncbi:Antibiotic biosynthesis monooxygenase [Planctomycetes bacterium MalM25]|nr:Antibiotic biosynthesis monooxygenase [Planctomycetes bacterium MalM25]